MPVYKETDKSRIPKNNNCWYFRAYYTNIYGIKRQKKSKMFSSKTSALEAERLFLSKVSTNDELNCNITFESVYNEWWELKKTQIKVTTQYSLKRKVDKHIYEWFKQFKLHSIKWNVLSEWRNDLLNKNISDEYKNSIIGYMKEFLTFAIDNYDYDKKVASKLQKQRINKRKDKINDAEINFWTNEEFNKFIKVVDDDLDKLMYEFLYYTGLRLGECISLIWKNVDLDNKKIKVTTTLTNKIENQIYAIVDPKTDNSFRVIGIDDKLTSKLRYHRLKEEKIYGFSEDWFMFGNVRYIAPTTFARHLNNWIEKANVKKISPHGFRHSHASLLIHLGCDSRDVADRLGDTVQVVEKTYAHLFPEKRSITLNKINELRNYEINDR